MKTMKTRNNLAVTVLALAMLAAADSALSALGISNLRLAGSPDSPHFYATTFSYANFPTNVSVSPGALVYFTTTVTGAVPPVNYQWYADGQPIVGATCSGVATCTYGSPGIELPPANYSVVASDASSLSVTSRVITLTIDPTFTKVNAANGTPGLGSTNPIVTDRGWSDCGTWGDYDGDGFPDLFVGNGLDAHGDTSALYHNNGDGTFTRIFVPVFNTPIIQSMTACWGDQDNDGKLDLFVLTTNSTPTGPNGGPLFFHNDGGGIFSRSTGGIVFTNSNTWGAAMADFNQDGFLDLFVTTFDASANRHSYLFRNNGDGTFTPQNDSAPMADLASGVSCAWADYDGDGRIDLFVTGGRGRSAPPASNRLYHNDGDGHFTRCDSITGSIVTDLAHSGGCAWGDYNNDGYPDLFVVNILGEPPLLYRNNGDGTFSAVTDPIVNGGLNGWFDGGTNEISCAWGDYDNDGFLDLVVTDEGSSAPFVNFIYHNNGDGTFTKVTTGSPVGEFSDSFTCSWVDYDLDGFLDLFAVRGDTRGNALYHNHLPDIGNTNAWFTVKLVGTVSNRSAIGAKVRVRAFYRGESRWQLRQVTGGNGRGGHDELWPHFGLGDATNIDAVRIEWPSGAVQEFQNVALRQFLTITEPPQLLARATNGVPQFSLKSGRFMEYDIQASTNLTAWVPIGTVAITNTDGTVPIVDTNAPGLNWRFYRAVSH